jgi:hypothetical protein
MGHRRRSGAPLTRAPARLVLGALAVLGALVGITAPAAMATGQPQSRDGGQPRLSTIPPVLSPLRPLSSPPSLTPAASPELRVASARASAALPGPLALPVPYGYAWLPGHPGTAIRPHLPAGLHPGRAPPSPAGT